MGLQGREREENMQFHQEEKCHHQNQWHFTCKIPRSTDGAGFTLLCRVSTVFFLLKKNDSQKGKTDVS